MKTKIYFIITAMLLASCNNNESDMQSLYQQSVKMESDILESVQKINLTRANYEKILTEAPESEFAPLACYKLGKLNEIFGHHEEAIEYYRKLASLFPDNPVCADGLFSMAQIYQLQLNQPEQAVIAYDQLINLYSDSQHAFKAMLEKSQLLTDKNLWKKAAASYQQILTKFPDCKINDDVVFRLGDIFFYQLKDSLQAEKMYLQLKQNYPNSSWISFAEKRMNELEQKEHQNEKANN